MNPGASRANKVLRELVAASKLVDASTVAKRAAECDGAGRYLADDLLERGLVDEQALLSALARHERTRFVSTEKLSKATILPDIRDLIARGMADELCVLPVSFDAATMTIGIVCPDASDTDLSSRIRSTTGARAVQAYVARPAAIRAAIAKIYGGDIHAFGRLDRDANEQLQSMLDIYDRDLSDDSSLAPVLANEMFPHERVLPLEPTAKEPERRTSGGPSNDSIDTGELMSVLVALLEQQRGGLRGHSAQVARITQKIVERIHVAPELQRAIVFGAYLHDLGKYGAYHLTALNVANYDGHRAAARKAYVVPERLCSAVGLPEATLLAIRHMYERYDGAGFPDGLSEKNIPLGARVLAVVDTFVDLTQHEKNPFRKRLTPAEACGAIVRQRGTVFDPNIADLVRAAVVGEEVLARLEGLAQTVLIIDDDAEETTVLELRLAEQGLDVRVARNADEALAVLDKGEIDFVVGEIRIEGLDGLKLLSLARTKPWGKELPWMIYTASSRRDDAERAFALGVVDFVTKPTDAVVFVQKIKALLSRVAQPKAAGGVAGSLTEMPLPELLQVLSQGQKSGRLSLRFDDGSGEVHLLSGRIVQATMGELAAHDAFYKLLAKQGGEFAFDSSFSPAESRITESTEALLLEGMRRLDEGLV